MPHPSTVLDRVQLFSVTRWECLAVKLIALSPSSPGGNGKERKTTVLVVLFIELDVIALPLLSPFCTIYHTYPGAHVAKRADVNEIQTDSVAEYGEQAIQILWKSTTELGCAVATCYKDAWAYVYLVCQYNPA